MPQILINPTGNRGAAPPNVADAFPDYAPSKGSDATQSAAEDFPDYNPSAAQKPTREVGTGEAIGKGIASGLSFGAAPAIEGLSEASGDTGQQLVENEAPTEAAGGATLLKPFIGAAKMLHEHFSDHPDPAVQEAYNRGREAALADQKLVQEQQPAAYLAGQVVGGSMLPLPGLGAASTVARIGKGAIAGGIGGGLYGAGIGLSEGESVGDIAKDALTGAAIGAPTGGVLGGVLGPRLRTGATPGQRAAQTAQDLGAPIPRGLASDNAGLNATTAKLRSVPILGSRISSAVDRTQEAAGEHIGGIVSATGGTDRAAADFAIRPALEKVVENNKNDINAAYNGLRSQISTQAFHTMPRTKAALAQIKHARREAGHANPGQGLEQFENIANGATFEGAHRARVDAREAGNALVPHPGYNAADFNKLNRAMTADIVSMVGKSAHSAAQAPAALRAFYQAEKTFGNLAEQNDLLHKLLNAKGEGTIATLLNAGKEKGGNLRLLGQLRATMAPKDFEQIGGTLLHELGDNPATGEFSLGRFVTGWNKLSAQGKAALFSPQHLHEIENIAGLGAHIKGALRESNTSHTAGPLILLDLARDAVVGAVAVGTGAVSGASMAMTAPFGAAGIIFTHWLASPAKAASMSAWTSAYRGVTSSPTPARKALFVIATRNLANNLGVPANDIARVIQGRLPLAAQPKDDSAKQ